MARKKRVWYPGACYHVMSRGIRRNRIFLDRLDYIRFLEIVGKVCEKHPFTIHSLCLMSNHFHMFIETKDTELWIIMQKILSIYAGEFNRRHYFTGHVFEGRYISSLIENDRHFLEVSRYIHLNPVKACMVDDPQKYDYSSYRFFVSDKYKRPRDKVLRMMKDLVDTSRVLSYFPDDPKEQYRIFVEGKATHEEHEQLIRKEMREDEYWLP